MSTIKGEKDGLYNTAKKASDDATAKAAKDKSAAMAAHKAFIDSWETTHVTGNF